MDPAKNAKEAEITAQMEADLALQRQKAEEARKRLEADRQQVETLRNVSGGMTLPGGGAGAAAMISDLEAAGDVVEGRHDAPFGAPRTGPGLLTRGCADEIGNPIEDPSGAALPGPRVIAHAVRATMVAAGP